MDVLETAASESEIWGALFSVSKMLFDAPEITVKNYYFQKLTGNNFERPAFLIKLIVPRTRPRNTRSRWLDLEMLVQYYSESEFDAIITAEKTMNLLAGWPQTILPKYDFSQTPPRKISFTGKDQNGLLVPHTTGMRIDPVSVRGAEPFQTEDGNWQVPITFTMDLPQRNELEDTDVITAISYQLLTQALNLPLEVSTYMRIDSETTEL